MKLHGEYFIERMYSDGLEIINCKYMATFKLSKSVS